MIPLPSYSQIAELFKKGATLEAQEQIMKLREAALELQEQNLTLTQELREARDQCSDLQQKLTFRAKLTFKKPLYYAESDPTPFCPVCFERDSRAIHLDGPYRYDDGQVSYVCHVCEKTIEVEHARRND